MDFFTYFKMLRPTVILLSFFAVFLAAIISGTFYLPYLLLASFIAFLISGGGNVLNDYFDYKIDRINKPQRPIPSGKIKRKNALRYSYLLLLSSFILLVVFFTNNVPVFLIGTANIFITTIYASLHFKRLKIPLLANLTDSWLVASTFLFGGLLFNTNISITILLLSILAFFANLGREIVKDIEDIKGDEKFNYKTLPITVGKNYASWIACTFVLFAIIFSFLPYLFNLLTINYLIFVLIADTIFAISCPLILISPIKAQKFMKIGMFIALISFLVGIF